MLKPIELHEMHEKNGASLMGTYQSVSPGLIMEKKWRESQIRGKKVPNAVIFAKYFNEYIFCIVIPFQTKSNHGSIRGHSQEPINCNDEGDVISWQSDRGQHNHHCDQTSLGDSGRSDTCSSGCDAVSLKRISIIFYISNIFLMNYLYFKNLT